MEICVVLFAVEEKILAILQRPYRQKMMFLFQFHSSRIGESASYNSIGEYSNGQRQIRNVSSSSTQSHVTAIEVLHVGHVQ